MSMNINGMNDLKAFGKCLRMTSGGGYATSIEKTTGGIYVDSKGKVHNVRGNVSPTAGQAANNRALRNSFVQALKSGHATEAFLRDVRSQLGVDEEGNRVSAEADKPLSRRELKVLLRAFNEGGYVKTEGEVRHCRASNTLLTADAGAFTGDANGWTVVGDLEDMRTKAANGLDAKAQEWQHVPPAHVDALRQQIMTAGRTTLNKICDELAKGNVDPLPFGNGPRDMDMPESVAKEYLDTLQEDMDGDGYDDDTAAGKILSDVNREWKICFGDEELSKSKFGDDMDATARKQKIISTFNAFFKPGEEAIKKGILARINQQIYSPLSEKRLVKGDMPGGVAETDFGKKACHEHRISVTRGEDGSIRVSFSAKSHGLSHMRKYDMSGNAPAPVTFMLENPEESYHETKVAYEVRLVDGKPSVGYVERPHVSYNYSKVLSNEEVKVRTRQKLADLLADKDALWQKLNAAHQMQIGRIQVSIDTAQHEIDVRTQKNTLREERRLELEATIQKARDQIKAANDLFQRQSVEDYLDSDGIMEKLEKDLSLADGPFSKSQLGNWNEDVAVTAIYSGWKGSLE